MDSLLRTVSTFLNGYMGDPLVKGLPILSMDPLSTLVYVGYVLVKGLSISSIVSLLRGMSRFIIWYMDEALINAFPNFINGFFFNSGLKICK